MRIGASNYMRRIGPGTNYAVADWGEHSADDCKALAGRLYAVYEVSDGWLRITQRGVGSADGQWISADAGIITYYNSKEDEPVENKLQKLCIVDATDSILASAREKGLPVEQRTCYLIGPASDGDAMDLWQQSQAEGSPYFASTTEV